METSGSLSEISELNTLIKQEEEKIQKYKARYCFLIRLFQLENT